jgi:hypothetical protein
MIVSLVMGLENSTGMEINPAGSISPSFSMFFSRHCVMKEGVVLVGVPEVPRLGLDEAVQVETADSVRPN